MRSSAPTTSYIRWAAFLLLVLAFGCDCQRRQAVQPPKSNPQKVPVAQLGEEANTFSAKVIAVKDGDSIVVLRDKEQVKIRLKDVDCPELAQPFGRQANLQLQIEASGRGRHENADLSVKAFELSQSPKEKWVTADYAEKRRYLEIVVLNFSLDSATLVPVWRKPFDMLAERLSVQQSRGDWI